MHQSTTPFQTERYSRPRHLAALFPFSAQGKNRKTSLQNRPIHWRTLYFSRNFSVIFKTKSVEEMVLIVASHSNLNSVY